MTTFPNCSAPLSEQPEIRPIAAELGGGGMFLPPLPVTPARKGGF
uniref:Uncharacterized protein n=1 Tax=Anguilla anguilla TaxID=7936 RepID=A0A0E9VRD0_ANGAN